MAPKDAALALVRENCPTELKQAFEFIFDVRENTKLPAKGEVGFAGDVGIVTSRMKTSPY